MPLYFYVFYFTTEVIVVLVGSQKAIGMAVQIDLNLVSRDKDLGADC
jgi:hypothetical protein